uniref:ATP synthase CF1 delta subunit n=1 Tax=Erythrolobus coxiae TaxID=362235 RepID=UPI001FCD97CB|nr:ATP synthase CF1 delta subunit [Erythrolobus coxiae]UNJ17661.1 ATP synthase CF1 delta subunit [Erythrolobus coxiae]
MQPYADALMELAISAKSIEEISNDMNNILSIVAESAELQKTLYSPLVNSESKMEVCKKIFENQINSTTLKFIMLLIDRKRIVLLNNIGEQFLQLAYEQTGTTVAEVVTSIPFNETQYDLLVKKIQDISQAKKVHLNINIDPDLIGGFTIQIGSKLIDSSLKGKLKQMASHLEVATI